MFSNINVPLKQFVYFVMFVLYSANGNGSPKHRNCFHNFNHRIQKCLDPFSKLFNTYQQTQDETSFSSIVKKHICFEYEKMLLCMHSTLTHCPTLHNIKRVQEKLGAEWVNNVNGLCRIPPARKTEQEVQPQHNSAVSNMETRFGKNTKNYKIPEIWDVIKAKDKLLQKKETEMWMKLKETWRQRVDIMKTKLRLTGTKSAGKGDRYTIYNIFYNSNSIPQIFQARLEARTVHSNSKTMDTSMFTVILCLTTSIFIGNIF